MFFMEPFYQNPLDYPMGYLYPVVVLICILCGERLRRPGSYRVEEGVCKVCGEMELPENVALPYLSFEEYVSKCMRLPLLRSFR